MHEASIAIEIIKAAESAVADRPGFRASRIVLRAGPLSGVDPASLRFAFEILAKEAPVVSGAELEIRDAQVSTSCRACGSGPFEGFRESCPSCRSPFLTVQGADDLVLETLEGDVEGGSGR